MPTTIQYFPVRGRGEATKLILAFKNVDFVLENVDYQTMKSDLKTFPFGQCPRYSDDDVTTCQSNAILRHLGRKYGMYGKTLQENAIVDQVLDGVEDLRGKYVALIYQAKLSDEGKAEYFSSHINPESVHGRNGGAHLKYLENMLLENNAGKGFVVGDAPTVADFALFDIADLHYRIFPQELSSKYPALLSFKERIEAIPEIKAYLDSPKRVPTVNGNGMG